MILNAVLEVAGQVLAILFVVAAVVVAYLVIEQRTRRTEREKFTLVAEGLRAWRDER